MLTPVISLRPALAENSLNKFWTTKAMQNNWKKESFLLGAAKWGIFGINRIFLVNVSFDLLNCTWIKGDKTNAELMPVLVRTPPVGPAWVMWTSLSPMNLKDIVSNEWVQIEELCSPSPTELLITLAEDREDLQSHGALCLCCWWKTLTVLLT